MRISPSGASCCALTLLASLGCGGDSGSASDSAAALRDRKLAGLRAGDARSMCEEIARFTTDVPAYVDVVCTSAGLSDAARSCSAAREACRADPPDTCWVSAGAADADDCDATTVGEVLDCMRASVEGMRTEYAGIACDDPASKARVDAAAASFAAGTIALPAGCDALARSCPSLTDALSGRGNSRGDDGGTASAPDGGAPVPEVNDPDPFLCGGAYRSPCASGKYCDFDDGCGTVGRCVPLSRSCTTSAVVCGCDGVTYDSECAAAAKGVGLAHVDACGASPYACGAFTCDEASVCIDVRPDRSDPDQQPFVCVARGGCSDCACVEAMQLGCYFGATCTSEAGVLRATCRD